MTAPTPTARHLELARRAVHASTMAVDDVIEHVAQLLAAEDAGRVPIAAAGAAYQRGRGDVIRAVRAEIARTTPPETDVEFGLRLLHLLDDLAGSAGRVDRLDVFRAWLNDDAALDDQRARFVDPDAALAALDAFEETPHHD